jgi:REP element-mobilizing transposase RayT
MARKPREKSETGVYHVTFRGNNKERIFRDASDKEKIIECIDKVRRDLGCSIYAYCIMSNHVHLLVDEINSDISEIVKRIKTKYSSWYNHTHGRVNHVFGDRFHSEAINDDIYMMSVIAYIFLNPVKAHIVKKPEEYKWSSCAAFFAGESERLVNIDRVDGVTDRAAIIEYTKTKPPIEHIE